MAWVPVLDGWSQSGADFTQLGGIDWGNSVQSSAAIPNAYAKAKITQQADHYIMFGLLDPATGISSVVYPNGNGAGTLLLCAFTGVGVPPIAAVSIVDSGFPAVPGQVYEAYWVGADLHLFSDGTDVGILPYGAATPTTPMKFITASSSPGAEIFDTDFLQAADVHVSEGRILSGITSITPDIRASQAKTYATINFPTKHEQISQAIALATTDVNGPMRASQGVILAAVAGRIANPRVRAWTYTLDGHDFYVLRLGDSGTLLYDTNSKQWYEWKNGSTKMWSVNAGFTWIGGQNLAYQYGSNIVVGDDSWGLLWFLDPTQPYDNHPDENTVRQQIPFLRIVTGQVVVRGRTPEPCYTIFLNGDNYGLTVTDFTPGVTLSHSDDQGKTYTDAETINVSIDTENLPYEWYSLGSIYAPGRMIQITDNGVFARIDSMGMNDDG